MGDPQVNGGAYSHKAFPIRSGTLSGRSPTKWIRMTITACITGENFLDEPPAQVPEMSDRVRSRMNSALSDETNSETVEDIKGNHYGLLWELFTYVLEPALGSPQRLEDLVERCFAFLEGVASSASTSVLGNLDVVIEDYLSGPLGDTAYSFVGPAFRTAMVRNLADQGVERPAEWR